MATPTTVGPETSFVNLNDTPAATETMVALAKSLSEGTIPDSARKNEIVSAILDAGIHTLAPGEDPWDKLTKMK